MQSRMQDFHFEFLNEDGSVQKVIANSEEVSEGQKQPPEEMPEGKAQA